MKILKLEPLTREAFQPFGEVLAADDIAHHYPINHERCVRYHHLATADAGDGKTIASVFRGNHAVLPFLLEVMERHPLGSQIFMPMTHHPYAIIVADTTSQPNEHDLRGFIARPKNHILYGVNYHKNIWHHPLIALKNKTDKTLPDVTSDFWVVDRLGDGVNLEEIDITAWQLYINQF
ncbi:MAG: ureidoglycolate lyase [Alphaproteobacteria bacterium]